ncbi:MAG TPA: VOC family protein [Planctomycetota bacterium]|nr:VOC family protein [Planctomycetota bacterium]
MKTPTSRLLRGAAYFPVADVDRSTAFYERVLGFSCEYAGGAPTEFAMCSRDGQTIMLKRVGAPERIVPNEKQGGTWDVYFWVDDARALHAELAARSADVVYGPLVKESYQMLEFAVRDSDGHVLGFGQTLPE